MMQPICPICERRSVSPSGDAKSKVLIIGEFPGQEELEKGRPFVGPAGKVFRKELNNVGLDLFDFRVTNLWVHEQTKDEHCYQLGYDLVLDEAKKKQAILLVGSEVVSTFTEYSVSKVSGLQVDSHLLSCQNIMAIINPAIVFQPGRGIGEIRFALDNFKRMLEEIGLA